MFWRGVVGYLPVQAVNAVVGVGSVVAFTRLLTPEQYGQYVLAFSLGAVGHTVLLVWAEAAMDRFHVAEVERGTTADHLATLYAAFAGIAVAAVALVLAALWVLPLDPAWELTLAVAAGSAAARTGMRLVQKRRRAEGEVLVYAMSSIASTLVGFALGVAAAAAGMGGAAPLFGSLAAALGFVLLHLRSEAKLAVGGRVELERAARYAQYGVPVASSLLLGLVLTTSDRLMIGVFLDAEAVGLYQAGYTVANRSLDLIFVWLGLAGAPAAVAALERGGPAGMSQALRSQAELMLLLTLPAAAGLALVAEPLAALVVGEAMREGAARVIPWIALAALFSGWTTYYFAQAFTLARRPGLLVVSMTPPALASVLLNVLLIPRLGLSGALFATTASFAVGAIATFVLGRRLMRLPLPVGAFCRSAVAVAVMAAAVAALPEQPLPLADLLLRATGGAMVYGLVLLVLERPFPSSAGARAAQTLVRPLRRVSRRPAKSPAA